MFPSSPRRKGLAKARIRRSGVSTSRLSRSLNQFQTRGAFCLSSDEQKSHARFFWQQTGQDRYIACC